jgi:hypothetical protein
MVGEIALFILWLVAAWLFNSAAKRFRKDIAALQHENLTLAKAIRAHSKRLDDVEQDARVAKELALEQEKRLTSEPVKPKIVAKPKPVTWKSFRSAAEKASEPEREEA